MAYKNIVFEGGGVKGIAYAGALQAIHDFGLYDGVERVAGTSAGAITACLVALGYSPKEIHDIIASTNFKQFEDGHSLLRLPAKYGLYLGDAFLAWMQERIKAKGLPVDVTFAGLRAKGLRDLHVFATDLNIGNVREFSFGTTPSVPVAEAVRASMSIPLFFKAWRFSHNNPDDHIYVDGGTVYNYPIETFDHDGVANPETIGLHLDNLGRPTEAVDLGYDEPVRYVKALFRTLLNSQVIDFTRNPEELVRTVRIDDFGISATDFDITTAQIEQLYHSGLRATTTFLEQQGYSARA